MVISQKRLGSCFFPLFLFIFLFGFSGVVKAQVNAVEFGKNRVQYGKMKFRYYQTKNFNTYFSQNGLALAKYVAQVAEKELPLMEDFVEYGSQRRINIVVYNSFNDLQQSNIGLGIEWQNTGGVTKFVNNKMIVYFDGNHANLRRQIRQGIAKTLLDNLLFGDNLGEFASNQALLDLPVWLTEGYIRYAAENWSPELDDKLKSALLSGKYRSFYQFAFDQPELAGHSFWRFIADNYRKDNVTYFLYLSRIYKSVNSASKKVTKKKFKEVLKEFMEKEADKYYADLKGRRNAPRGNVVAIEDVNKNLDYYRFQANPNPRNNTYAVVRFKRGVYRIELEDFGFKRKILLQSGVLDNQNEINPNYPQLAWDPKGTRLVVVYMKENKLRMFVYDLTKRLKTSKQTLPEEFQQVNDVKYMLDENTLLFSAVKNGYSDIFVYKINEQTVQQITNDVYDDLDPTFIAFPSKTGIIFSSNRPSGNAVNSDTALPSNNRFNVFLVDNWNRSDFRQITQLTNVAHGNARYPMQYNTNHFTFVNDEMGIANRYAGFFTTRAGGVDTVYRIGDEFLRNPDRNDLDSTLQVWNKTEPDSIAYMAVRTDSAYSFPITNYQSNLQETRIAGDRGQVSEVRQEGDMKMLYKLRVNDDALKRRNVTVRPTDYMKKVIDQERVSRGVATIYQPAAVDTGKADADIFQSEFENEEPEVQGRVVQAETPVKVAPTILSQAKLYDYRLRFSTQYSVTGFNNSVLMTRWQPYAGGNGPVYMTNGNSNLNGMIRLGVTDLFEDVKFIGGFRMGLNLDDRDVMLSYQNLKRRVDWGLTYYRSTVSNYLPLTATTGINRLVSNLYQFNVTLPFDKVRSVRATVAYRLDRVVYRSDIFTINPIETLKRKDDSLHAVLTHLEYVHDNTIQPALNIWNGLRYKVFSDINVNLTPGKDGKRTFNVGTDIRYYYPIYRNFIWAGRAAADFSFGGERMIFYLGGTDGWINPKFNDGNKPGGDYTYQTLAVNMRGYRQNAAHGNNAIVLNSEFRLPVFTTLISRPINNAFVRNFQITQFVDLGTAWEGKYNQISRPGGIYSFPPGNSDPSVIIKMNSGGLGPFAGGYGFGARSTLLGYFLKVDAGWPMSGFFSGKPIWYFSLGLDF